VPAAPLTVTALVSSATVLGALHLAFGSTFDAATSLVTGAGMVLLTVVAASGTLLARGRWAGPTDAAIALTWIGIAVASPLRALSIAVLTVAAGALTASLGPWLRRWLRHLPRADGPPPAAVIVLLTLVATPTIIGLASTDGVGPGGIALSVWSVALAFGLARLVSGSLAAVRVLHPVASIAVAVEAGLPGAVAVVAAGVTAAALAWRREVGLAIAPAVPRRADAFAIPPELAPPEVLDAAGLDETGRPRRQA